MAHEIQILLHCCPVNLIEDPFSLREKDRMRE
jgi:hypothetical protein